MVIDKTGEIQHSEVCCTLPPFLGSSYKPTGSIVNVPGLPLVVNTDCLESDLDVYVTGKKDSEIAIICIYGTIPIDTIDR
jgi:hypothetical protein